jgi:hypothetical protein
MVDLSFLEDIVSTRAIGVDATVANDRQGIAVHEGRHASVGEGDKFNTGMVGRLVEDHNHVIIGCRPPVVVWVGKFTVALDAVVTTVLSIGHLVTDTPSHQDFVFKGTLTVCRCEDNVVPNQTPPTSVGLDEKGKFSVGRVRATNDAGAKHVPRLPHVHVGRVEFVGFVAMMFVGHWFTITIWFIRWSLLFDKEVLVSVHCGITGPDRRDESPKESGCAKHVWFCVGGMVVAQFLVGETIL